MLSNSMLCLARKSEKKITRNVAKNFKEIFQKICLQTNMVYILLRHMLNINK